MANSAFTLLNSAASTPSTLTTDIAQAHSFVVGNWIYLNPATQEKAGYSKKRAVGTAYGEVGMEKKASRDESKPKPKAKAKKK